MIFTCIYSTQWTWNFNQQIPCSVDWSKENLRAETTVWTPKYLGGSCRFSTNSGMPAGNMAKDPKICKILPEQFWHTLYWSILCQWEFPSLLKVETAMFGCARVYHVLRQSWGTRLVVTHTLAPSSKAAGVASRFRFPGWSHTDDLMVFQVGKNERFFNTLTLSH